jgi:hypothetical protein
VSERYQAWWQNLVLGEGGNSIYPIPYMMRASSNGLSFSKFAICLRISWSQILFTELQPETRLLLPPVDISFVLFLLPLAWSPQMVSPEDLSVPTTI